MKISQVFNIFKKRKIHNLNVQEKAKSVTYQYFAAITGNARRHHNGFKSFFIEDFFHFFKPVNVLTICEGIGIGWPCPTINLLMSNDSPLPTGKIDMDEASWIASLICVGGVVGNVIFGYIANKFGRKIPLLLIPIPMIVSLLQKHTENVMELLTYKTVILISRSAGC